MNKYKKGFLLEMAIQGTWLPSCLFVHVWWWPLGVETCSIL